MFYIFLKIFLFFNISAFSQNTEIYLGVEKNFSEDGIILSNFTQDTTNQTDIYSAEYIKEIVRTDLMLSRYFLVTESDDDVITPALLSEYSKKSKFLVTAQIGTDDKNNISIKQTIYNTELKNKILIKKYITSQRAVRKAAHMMSNDIIEKTIGKKGIATSQITFSNDSTGHKEIYVIDYDGENLTQLTNHKSISIIPKWTNDGTKIYYTSYRYGNPDLFIIDMSVGKIKPFSKYQGLNVAGGFSPDDKQFVLTLSRGKDPSIYMIDILTKDVKKLLDRFGVCSSPTFSPDSKEVAFISDRAGKPQLYIYNIENQKYRKLTNFYWVDSPNWSPDGKWITFSARETRAERLNIFIMDPTTSVIKRLTRNEGDNEDPSFSPDSRFISFTSTRKGKKQIYIMDIDGSSPRLLSDKIKGTSSTPMWSR
ncbi:MAG: PD40 domain-containing protein [Elusimicrobiales bacterium]|nr:PD40 domain-containing protein [Elusimicrobiales bacterium]